MEQDTVVASAEFDILGSRTKMTFRLYFPKNENDTWACRFAFDDPMNVDRKIFGESSLQSLVLALKAASAYLYGSQLYKARRIGLFSEFDRELILPATKEFLDIAPYPF